MYRWSDFRWIERSQVTSMVKTVFSWKQSPVALMTVFMSHLET